MPRAPAPSFRFRVTPPGGVYVFLTLAFGVQAVLAGNNLVFLIFTLMAGFGLSLAALPALLPSRVAVRRRLPEAAYAGEAFEYPLEISNPRRWAAAFCLQIEDHHTPPGPGSPPLEIALLKPGHRTLLPAKVTTPSRGWLVFEGILVRAVFPFGLFEAQRWLPLAQRLLVYPQRWIYPSQAPLPACLLAGTNPAGGLGVECAEFLGLREFHPGDPPRQVHWHSAGRVPDLMLVRQFEPPREGRIALVLDSFFSLDEEARCRAAFEDNICLALALIERLLAQRFEVTFAGFAGAPRWFHLDTASPALKELRLWLATLEPERHQSPFALLSRVPVAPGARAILLSLPTRSERPPAELSAFRRLTAEEVKPFLVPRAAAANVSAPS